MLRSDWERVYKENDLKLWHSIKDVIAEYPYEEQKMEALGLLDKYFRTKNGGPLNLSRFSWNQYRRILIGLMEELEQAVALKEVKDGNEWERTQREEESLETRLQRENDEAHASASISIREAQIPNPNAEKDSVDDFKEYVGEMGSPDFNSYVGKINKDSIEIISDDIKRLYDKMNKTNDPTEISRIQDEIKIRQKREFSISYRHADAVSDTAKYWSQAGDAATTNYWSGKKKKKSKKKKKKGKKKASAVPNPLRRNYDYSGEMGGPEWQNRVKTYMKIKDRRKKRKAQFEVSNVKES